MKKFTLKEDGDKFEQEWEKDILPNFPNYEVYWSEYVVPLTYCTLKKEVIYLRRSVPELLKKPANFNYEIFLHLVGCRIAREEMTTNLNPFNLYNFFNHINSAVQDKCYGFLHATEDVIHNYTGKKYRDQEMRFTNLGYPSVHANWEILKESTGRYRNKLVHTGYIIYTKDKTMLIEKIKEKGLYEELSSINYLKLGPKIIKSEIDREIISLVGKEKAFRISLKKLI